MHADCAEFVGKSGVRGGKVTSMSQVTESSLIVAGSAGDAGKVLKDLDRLTVRRKSLL
jgi:hypothetical protein